MIGKNSLSTFPARLHQVEMHGLNDFEGGPTVISEGSLCLAETGVQLTKPNVA